MKFTKLFLLLSSIVPNPMLMFYIFFFFFSRGIEISHINMAGDAEQTDSSGKYTFGGGGQVAKKYWPTILKSVELVSSSSSIGSMHNWKCDSEYSQQIFISILKWEKFQLIFLLFWVSRGTRFAITSASAHVYIPEHTPFRSVNCIFLFCRFVCASWKCRCR